MSKFILDLSANTHKNDWEYLKKMLVELKSVDTGKHQIVIKHQLFVKAGDNIPLDRYIFGKAYTYAKDLGYETTSSVFDKESLDFLLQHEIPFVKIANNRNLDWLIGEIPRKIPVYVSAKAEMLPAFAHNVDNEIMACVSNYPATFEEYEKEFTLYELLHAISDHTTNWDLYKKYVPEIYECHYKLSDSTGLDSGPFARTPEMLQEVL